MISVVITSYNYGHFIPFALESVLNQTYRDIEVIVVNDGSTDNTEEVIAPYRDNLKVRYIYQHNKGQASAKNRGIEEAKGELIAFLDADDIWIPEKLEKQIPLFQNQKVGVVFAGFMQIDEFGMPVRRFKNLCMFKGSVSNELFLDNFVCFPSTIVRRKCFEELGIFDETLKMGIDWDLWLRFSTKYEFDYIDEALVKYRVGHSGQMSKNMECRFECAEQIMKKFISNHKDVLTKGVESKAWAITWRNRCNYYYKISRKRGLYFLIKAMRQDFICLENIKLFIKCLLKY